MNLTNSSQPDETETVVVAFISALVAVLISSWSPAIVPADKVKVVLNTFGNQNSSFGTYPYCALSSPRGFQWQPLHQKSHWDYHPTWLGTGPQDLLEKKN